MIKEIIAIIFLLSFSIPTVRLIFVKKLEVKAAVTVLMFALFGAFAIANYDVIQKIKWGTIEVETAKKEITRIKEGAIDDIKKEVGQQKESINLLISHANDTREKMEQQKKSLAELIRTGLTKKGTLVLKQLEIGWPLLKKRQIWRNTLKCFRTYVPSSLKLSVFPNLYQAVFPMFNG